MIYQNTNQIKEKNANRAQQQFIIDSQTISSKQKDPFFQQPNIMDKVQKQNASIESVAYKKILYHCLRYSSSKVYGALVVNNQNPNRIINAFPLFHTPIVNPTLAIALDLIESNLSANQQIAGFYEFIQTGDSSINRIIETNTNLKGMKNLRLWTVDSKQIKFGMAGFNLSCPDFKSVKQNILKGDHHFIVDFDAHLEQIELDFTNSYVK